MSCLHKLRKLKSNSRMRYECMECGKRLHIMSGVLCATTNAEAEAYYERKRERYMEEAKQKIEALKAETAAKEEKQS